MTAIQPALELSWETHPCPVIHIGLKLQSNRLPHMLYTVTQPLTDGHWVVTSVIDGSEYDLPADAIWERFQVI